MQKEKIVEMHEHINALLESNIDIALSESAIKELHQLDMFLQWVRR